MENSKLSIGFIGTRGIPNQYGGYEAAIQELAPRLSARGHEVVVYCSASQTNKVDIWKGVKLVYSLDPEKYLGSSGQFIYDLISNIKSYRYRHDVIFHMGYTSDSVLYRFWYNRSLHITNMDGMEWMRTKYSRRARKFLSYAEKLAANKSDLLIADNKGVEEYLTGKFSTPVFNISYGVEIPKVFNLNDLELYNMVPQKYDLLIARIVPENNIETAIKAKLGSTDKFPLVIIGNRTNYRDHLIKEYGKHEKILFKDGNFNAEIINSLRHFSRYYIHGHSVGGTNPSLLEAMAAGCRIFAHDNVFNRNVLFDGGIYFSSVEQLSELFSKRGLGISEKQLANNITLLQAMNNWEKITDLYEQAAQRKNI